MYTWYMSVCRRSVGYRQQYAAIDGTVTPHAAVEALID